MNISETNKQQFLDRLKIKELNEMQISTIDAVEKNNQIVLLSATGSGKTLAFLLPVINALDSDIRKVQALILVPSRELALQIESVLKQMQTGYKITACYGGHKREIEENNLVQPPAIIIGTAGRMADHIRRDNFDTEFIKFLVLDEFDMACSAGCSLETRRPIANKETEPSATRSTPRPRPCRCGSSSPDPSCRS